MTYKPSRLVEKAWAMPPRCVAAFNVEPLKSPLMEKGVFNDVGYFYIRCRCQCDEFTVHAFVLEDGLIACPVQLKCTRCGFEAEIFDIAKHGYDAELGHGCFSIRGKGDASIITCDTCHKNTFKIMTGFSYQIEPVEELSVADQERVEDLFDWFILDATCQSCEAYMSIVDYECA